MPKAIVDPASHPNLQAVSPASIGIRRASRMGFAQIDMRATLVRSDSLGTIACRISPSPRKYHANPELQ